MNVLIEVVEFMKELSEDNTLPKNLKDKVNIVIDILNDEGDVSMKISKAMHELESIVDDRNLQAYSRTQLYNVISQLESI